MNQYIFKPTATRNMVVAFFVGIVFGCLFAYVWTDEARIEREQDQLAQVSQIVKAHYAKECGK